MDQTLKDRLRRRKLMPLDVDSVIEKSYENNGQIASESYTKQEEYLTKRIEENLFQLCVLERKNFQGERYYRILENQINKDLFELDMIDAYRCIYEEVGKRFGRWTTTNVIDNNFYFTSIDECIEHTLRTDTVDVINYSKKIFIDK